MAAFVVLMFMYLAHTRREFGYWTGSFLKMVNNFFFSSLALFSPRIFGTVSGIVLLVIWWNTKRVNSYDLLFIVYNHNQKKKEWSATSGHRPGGETTTTISWPPKMWVLLIWQLFFKKIILNETGNDFFFRFLLSVLCLKGSSRVAGSILTGGQWFL